MCQLWVTSSRSPSYQATGCFRGQTSRSRGRFSELESERLLYSKAVIQIVGNQDI